MIFLICQVPWWKNESSFSIPASGGEKNGKNGNRHDQGCNRAAAVELPRGSPDEPEQSDDDQKSKHSHTSFLIFEYKKHPAIYSTAECYLWSRFPFMSVAYIIWFMLLWNKAKINLVVFSSVLVGCGIPLSLLDEILIVKNKFQLSSPPQAAATTFLESVWTTDTDW